MNTARRNSMKLLAAATLAFAADMRHAALADDGTLRRAKVFTLSNEPNNELFVFASPVEPADGALRLLAVVPTGGRGTGTGLGSQGALALSADRDFLFAVNAESSSISAFAVDRRGVQLVSVVPSGGEHPISVTEHGGVVYVLNAGGAGNVAGFRNKEGQLEPISSSTSPLSGAATNPAQVGFSQDGDVLLVTERATNLLTTYEVRPDGTVAAPQSFSSSGLTPFGFAFSRRDTLLVSEAFGGAANSSAVSSYEFGRHGSTTPELVSGSIASTQTAACWVAITPNGRFGYTGNTGSDSVTAYRIGANGELVLLAPIAAQSGPTPVDVAVAPDGRRLFVLNRGGNIAAFAIAADGGLHALSSALGLPAGTTGIVAN
jgi:6-phosphogluconolactonase (cycloisomerase 2 family)